MAETTNAANNSALQAKAVAATLEVKGPSRSLMMDAWFRLVRNKAAVAGGSSNHAFLPGCRDCSFYGAA